MVEGIIQQSIEKRKGIYMIQNRNLRIVFILSVGDLLGETTNGKYYSICRMIMLILNLK